MIMLYRDPKGESVGSFAPEASGPIFGTNQSNTNEEEKVTLLQKTLKEKENKINKLTLEIETLKVRERERERLA